MTGPRYQLLGRLGVGLMGEVQHARDLSNGGEMALKFLSAAVQANADAMSRLRRMVDVSSRIDHPGLLRYRHLGRLDGRPYIAMDLLVGESLEERLLHAPLPLAECVEVAQQITESLAAAHKAGWIHGGLNPAAVFLNKPAGAEAARVVLTDLGLSPWSEVAAQQSDAGGLQSAKYLAPEQIRGLAADGRADVFALGVIFYEMLTGDEPFPVDDPMRYAEANCNAFVRDPKSLRRELPVLLAEVVQRMLARELTVRYDVRGLLSDLFVVAREIDPARGRPSGPATLPGGTRGSSVRLVAAAAPRAPAPQAPVLPPARARRDEGLVAAQTAARYPSSKLPSSKPVPAPPPPPPRRPAMEEPPAPEEEDDAVEVPASGTEMLDVDGIDLSSSESGSAEQAGDVPFNLTSRRVRVQKRLGIGAAIAGGVVVVALLVYGAVLFAEYFSGPSRPIAMPPPPAQPTVEELAREREEQKRRAVRELLRRGQEAMEAGNWERAKEIFQEARIRSPEDEETASWAEVLRRRWLDAATSLAAEGKHEDAARLFGRISKAYPADAASAAAEREEERKAAVAEGDRYQESGQREQAAEAYRRARSLGAVEAEVKLADLAYGQRFEKARTLEEEGRWTQAAEAYKEVLELRPGDAASREGADRCLGRAAAVAERERLVAEGIARRDKGEYLAALESLEAASKIPPLADDELDGRIRTLRTEAVSWFLGIARSSVRESKMNEAAEALEMALRFRPDDPELRRKAARGPWIRNMVYVPAGEFTMGADDGRYDQAPQRKVWVDAYLIDRTEVSNEEYESFQEATGHRAPSAWKDGKFPSGDGGFPVTGVSWQDARAYAAWSGKRLPTEAEWERAARGGDARKWPWGDLFESFRCNSRERGRGVFVAVDSFPEGASPIGCLHLSGNVGEWVEDAYRPYPGYQGAPVLAFEEDRRVIRGGSYQDTSESVRATARLHAPPDASTAYDGFRCAADADW